jgi:hypothetical protein
MAVGRRRGCAERFGGGMALGFHPEPAGSLEK